MHKSALNAAYREYHITMNAHRPFDASPSAELRGGRTAPSVHAGAPSVEDVLTPDACDFLDALITRFSPRIAELLAARIERQARFDWGELPDFLPGTVEIRESDWTVSPAPAALQDRRVEITGPAEPKMIINGLNSGARVYMADFEDSLAPTWSAVIGGHAALSAAVRGTLTFSTPERTYTLNPTRAALFVRPRGLHLFERHYLAPLSAGATPAALFDFGLHCFHNARAAVDRGAGPWFYLPKLQSHLEARLWAEVFAYTEAALKLPTGTIRATVLIETLPAAFEMDEILWELRPWSAGLNCGRWDYIFSTIKTLRAHPDRLLPDRDQVGMDRAFLAAYARHLVGVCHRRGAHAMGGMAAQIPLKDPEANERALARVRADKLREVTLGHDGTWVAHPGLVKVALEAFDAHMPGPNQLHVLQPCSTREAMLTLHEGTRTEAGLRRNLRVGVLYLEAWLRGVGCVPIDGLMEDAATAEISRAQVWQWQRWRVALADGSVVTPERVATLLAEEVAGIAPGGPALDAAADLFLSLCTGETLADFLTIPAYTLLTKEST